VGEAGAAEVLDRALVDAVVLAEHEAASERRLAWWHAAPEGVLGAAADPVQGPAEAAAAGACQVDPRRPQDHRDALAAQRPAVPGGRRREDPGGAHLRAEREVGHRLAGLHEDAAGLCVHLYPHLAAATPRDRGDEATQSPWRAGSAVQRAAVDRGQPGTAGEQPGAGRNGGDQQQPERARPAAPRPGRREGQRGGCRQGR
jgi:hypothetical protein